LLDKLNERLEELMVQRQQAQMMLQQAQTMLQKVSIDILMIDGGINEINRLIKQESEA